MFTRMFCAEQIQIPPDLPPILKAYSKAVIRAKPTDLISFSIDYFKKMLEEPPTSSAGYRITLQELQDLRETLTDVLKTQNELKRVDYQVACEDLGICPDVLANILRLGFADQETIDLYMFMGIASTLVSPNFDKTILNLFKIFEDEQCQSKIPTAAFINFYEFMASKDPSIPQENVKKLKDSANEEFITYDKYQSIFESDE
ncbi:Ropporin-1-like protein [Histomonas meleagridis]|uniref:Ropporin-1-like protein n=1 Tax=Histomonas meleagridis TaxID=135588 RepID=UPI0035595DDD|nr:Ropporin-1-like protein [Histomonas meleagridis]KAH0805020.1 Ropporin-1-like protein [Histomonas meleagridis]